VVRYESHFAFLGFYIARPEIRGKGYGIQIWRAGMEWLAGRNVGLDGVVAQQANYRKSGFVLAWNNSRFEGAVPDAGVPGGVELIDARTVPFDLLADYDRRFFPARRDAFLSSWISLPGRHALVALRDGRIEGLAAVRSALGPARIGPLYASTEGIAAALIAGVGRAAKAERIAIDVPDRNRVAVGLMESMGLQPAFDTARMYTNGAPEIDEAGLFGVTSLELG